MNEVPDPGRSLCWTEKCHKGGLLAKSEPGWHPGGRSGERECSVSPGGCGMSWWAWVCRLHWVSCACRSCGQEPGPPCPARVCTPRSTPLTPSSCLCPSQPSPSQAALLLQDSLSHQKVQTAHSYLADQPPVGELKDIFF